MTDGSIYTADARSVVSIVVALIDSDRESSFDPRAEFDDEAKSRSKVEADSLLSPSFP